MPGATAWQQRNVVSALTFMTSWKNASGISDEAVAAEQPAGVVDEDVDAAEVRLRAPDRARHLGALREVRAEGRGPAAERRDLAHDLAGRRASSA